MTYVEPIDKKLITIELSTPEEHAVSVVIFESVYS